MNYKIVTPNSLEYPDVLVYYDRDDNGAEIVIIRATGTIDENEGMFAIEKVIFDSMEIAQEYVELYSEEMAFNFCVRNEITN